MACFYSLCFSLSFFISSSSSSHSAINPNSHLSDQREGWSFSLLIHLQFAHRRDAPVHRERRARSAPQAPVRPARPLGSALHCLGGQRAGPVVGGQAPLPRMFLLLGSLTPHMSACPLSWAPLLGRSGGHGAWPKTGPCLCAQARPALCSRWSSGVVVGAVRAVGLYTYLWSLPQSPSPKIHVCPSSVETAGKMKGKG